MLMFSSSGKNQSENEVNMDESKEERWREILDALIWAPRSSYAWNLIFNLI